MECPFCINEMRVGFISPSGFGGVCWVDEAPGWDFAPRLADGFMELTKEPILGRAVMPAHICESCKVILIDYGREKPKAE